MILSAEDGVLILSCKELGTPKNLKGIFMISFKFLIDFNFLE